jgi:alpha-1,2-mannosyltransferase
LALEFYYHAPLSVAFALESVELPRILNVTGLLPTPLINATAAKAADPYYDEEEAPRIDLGPIAEFGLRLCVGKEWHRFPGSFLIPDGVDIRFIKSEFNGLVPGRYPELVRSDGSSSGGPWSKIAGTKSLPLGMNDLNQEQLAHYVST